MTHRYTNRIGTLPTKIIPHPRPSPTQPFPPTNSLPRRHHLHHHSNHQRIHSNHCRRESKRSHSRFNSKTKTNHTTCPRQKTTQNCYQHTNLTSPPSDQNPQ